MIDHIMISVFFFRYTGRVRSVLYICDLCTDYRTVGLTYFLIFSSHVDDVGCSQKSWRSVSEVLVIHSGCVVHGHVQQTCMCVTSLVIFGVPVVDHLDIFS